MLNAREIEKFQKLPARNDGRLPIVFNALGDARRCAIFRSFLPDKRLCVSDIARIYRISMSLASQHLKILEITGLLTREKEGRTVYFRPNAGDVLVKSIIKAVQ